MKTYLKPAAILLTDLNVLSVVRTQYQFNQTIQQVYPFDDSEGSCFDAFGDLQFNFVTGGLTPSGVGTLTCQALGDLDDGQPDGGYTINFEAEGDLSPVLGGNGGQCDLTGVTEIYSIPLASLQAAASDGTIVVTAIPGDDIGCFCGDEQGESPNQVTCTLEFPAS